MNEPQQISPRQRLQQLLAIPERQRSDAEWDEINDLEIKLAPGNREGAPEQGNHRNVSTSGGQPKSGGPKPGGGGPGKKQFRKSNKSNKRPPRGGQP